MTHFSRRENEILQNVVSILKHDLRPRRILLFGSRAQGINDPHSDFDFAVEGSAPRSQRLAMQMNESIEKIAGLYAVDVVFLNRVDRDFRDLVINTGKVLYENTRNSRRA